MKNNHQHAWKIFLLVLSAMVPAAWGQIRITDGFDVGNVQGGDPVGWTILELSGAGVRAVDSTVTSPRSASFCLELRDDSSSSRPEISRSFRATPEGRITAFVKINVLNQAPLDLQLLTTNGTFLAAIRLASDGKVSYNANAGGAGAFTVSSALWATGQWQSIQVDWLGDNTFTAFVQDKMVANRVAFGAGQSPGRVLFTAGSGSLVGRLGYVDDVLVSAMDGRIVDGFDQGVVGSTPTNWTISEPASTEVRVVDATVAPPSSAPFSVKFSDSSTTTNPEMWRDFLPTPIGTSLFSVRMTATNHAPFYMHLRSTNGTFLAAIRVGEDGKMAYNANAGGSGAFTVSSVAWNTGIWQTIRVNWFTNNAFNAYLGTNSFATQVPFGAALSPGRNLFRLASSTQTGRLGYLDDVMTMRPVLPGPFRYPNAGTWLSHAYVTSQSSVDSVPMLALDMKVNYGVLHWFVNVGLLDGSGRINNPAVELSKAVAFLDKLKTWETQNGYSFKALAWISGDTAVVDAGNVATRSNIVNECQKLISTTVSGSYVAGATRAFDGVQIDLEPSGLNDTRFNNLKTLMDDVRAGFVALGMGTKLTSFTPHKYGTASPWEWSPVYYYDMAQRVDFLAAMTYDSGLTTGAAYQGWMQGQTTNILRAVSGKYWNNDAQHPAPANGVKVFVGFPAFPNNSFHTNTAENAYYAALGARAGLTNLMNSGDFSTNYFQGASMYLHTTGDGGDGYADFDTDWWSFAQDWQTTW